MAIKKFKHKALKPDDTVTSCGKSAIIETKEQEYCYPQYGKTVKARSKDEADEKIKSFIK